LGFFNTNHSGPDSGAIGFLFDKSESIPRIFTIWVLICLLLFSPLRYILLQLFIATAYPFQSFGAFFSSIILAFYMPIVFCILYAIGIGLPFLGVLAIVGFKDQSSKIRLWLSAIATPVICVIATWLYFLVLPYAAYSTHWLRSEDIIRATNGPSEYYFNYVAEQMTPLQFPEFVLKMGLENLSAKERLRSHVASVYLGERAFSFFVYKSYPDEFEQKTGYKVKGN
jgi:4-amino-4-deoxy-L-arabinose transferase-like glycosyltransferase